MSQRNVKPVSVTLGAAFLATAITAGANAEVNPFSAQPLSTGYDILHLGAEGKCGEGKCVVKVLVVARLEAKSLRVMKENVAKASVAKVNVAVNHLQRINF